MADKETITELNFDHEGLNTPRSVGGYNVRFVRCYWPKLDRPTKLFKKDSVGIEVQGPPTPRNVIFPEGTVFLPVVANRASFGEEPRWEVTDIPTKSDCFFERRTERQVVTELQDVTETMELGGVMQEVTYKKPVPVERDVEVMDDLTPAEAMDRAKGD